VIRRIGGRRRDSQVPVAADHAPTTSRRPSLLLGAGTAAALVVGVGLLGWGLSHNSSASPTPPSPVTDTRQDTSPHSDAASPTVHALSASVPTTLDIPAIKVHSRLLTLGLNSDHTVQVPPLSRDSRAGWYRYSPSPGQTGPAVILGHVDSARYGPGVFFRLGALRTGDAVRVARSDGSTVTFRITRVAEYRKSAFPTKSVYGPVNSPELRLITCGGRFDPSQRSYVDNIVVYASMTGEVR